MSIFHFRTFFIALSEKPSFFSCRRKVTRCGIALKVTRYVDILALFIFPPKPTKPNSRPKLIKRTAAQVLFFQLITVLPTSNPPPSK
ncbi:hypothetical protein [Chlorogloea sp. CCALA 695]|uniref:hypothetical protein n=1 Tax=Chlorogloea sp. CCALA 695 TaxID=2107693 RepID=UPI0011B27A8D|nr:hypothetical protein [Chlorogloea sp. CCALA 695]